MLMYVNSLLLYKKQVQCNLLYLNEYLAHRKRVAEFVEIACGQLVREVVLYLLVREALANALRKQPARPSQLQEKKLRLE